LRWGAVDRVVLLRHRFIESLVLAEPAPAFGACSKKSALCMSLNRTLLHGCHRHKVDGAARWLLRGGQRTRDLQQNAAASGVVLCAVLLVTVLRCEGLAILDNSHVKPRGNGISCQLERASPLEPTGHFLTEICTLRNQLTTRSLLTRDRGIVGSRFQLKKLILRFLMTKRANHRNAPRWPFASRSGIVLYPKWFSAEVAMYGGALHSDCNLSPQSLKMSIAGKAGFLLSARFWKGPCESEIAHVSNRHQNS
jgi:hypothetical protein